MDISDEIRVFIEERLEKLKQEARDEKKASIKAHFDYCVHHAGNNSKFMWLRNELFGKDS